MALFNEILAGRFNKQLLKMFNMKGQAPAPQVSGDISAEVNLESDRPEWGFLKGENRFFSRATITNGAASNGRVRHRVTANNVLVVVTSIRCYSTSIASEFQLYVGGATYTADLAIAVSGPYLADTRGQQKPGQSIGAAGQIPMIVSGENTTTNSDGQVYAKAAAPINSSVELLPGPLILASKDCQAVTSLWPLGFDVRCESLNANFLLSLYGYCRSLEEGEQVVN